MLLFTKSKTKLLTILISILLVIQPLSGCIADFSFEKIAYKNKNLSKEQKESLQKALTVSSLIDAKTVNLQTNTGVIIKGSQIQATTVNFMANFLNLISDKNSESYSSFSDSSGVVTRTIISKGYVKEEAVEAKVNAQQITLNGKTLLEDKLKPENLLKQLSSEYNLNEAQISQVKAQLTNKEWYDKTTTLSKMGMIIVQAVVTVLTAGTGTGFVAGINATVDAMVNAAINSMITQTLTQLATAAITGNKLELDINTLLTNSLKAAALSGLTAQIDTNLGLNKDNLSYADKATKQILHGFAQKAVYGGSLESILATSVGNVAFDYIGHELYKDVANPIIPVTATHAILGGALAELAGGDFSQGAIATTTSHLVAEYYLNTKLEALKNGDKSSTLNDKQLMAITDAIGGAIVLATHEKVSDEDLKIAQGMSHSVVENNVVPIIAAVEAVSATMTTAEIAVLGSAISSLGAVVVYNIIKDNSDNLTEALNIAIAQKNGEIGADYKGAYIPKPSADELNQDKFLPDLSRAKSKTPVQGGGGLRPRWTDKDGNIYEWDSQHGEMELYDKRGNHKGSYNPKSGEQKPPVKGRSVEK